MRQKGLAFGTGGLRGVMGAGMDHMNPDTVARATQGLAAYLSARGGKSAVIAYDTRRNSDTYARVAARVLESNGIQAFLFEQAMPTPILSYAVRALRCAAGVVITASHNPAEYNGYKVYGPDGGQITDETARDITAYIEAVPYGSVRWEEDSGITPVPPSVYAAYMQETLQCRVIHPTNRLTVVYSPLNGAGFGPIREIIEHLPYVEAHFVPEQCTPDGSFATCPKPNPEVEAAWELALRTAREKQADIVILTDPDCDRAGVAVRTRDNAYHRMSGNEMGLLLLDLILYFRTQAGTLPKDAVAVKTIVSSDLAFPIARAYGVEVIEVLTGFKYIGEVIKELDEQGCAARFVFGFEESCGYLAGTHVRDKDGVMAFMLLCDMAAWYAGEGLNLYEACERLYQTHGYIENLLISKDVSDAAEIVKSLRAALPQELNGLAVSKCTDYLDGGLGLPKADVLSLENANGDKVILRPSGTEPKIKAYLTARGGDKDTVTDSLGRMAEEVETWMAVENRRRILLINEFITEGGAEQIAAEQMKLFSARGYQVGCLCFSKGKAVEIPAGYDLINVSGTPANKLLFNPLLYRRIRRFLRSFAPDTILVHNMFSAPLTQYRALKGFTAYKIVHDYYTVCPKSTCTLSDGSVCQGYRRADCMKSCGGIKVALKLWLLKRLEPLVKQSVKRMIPCSQKLSQYLSGAGYDSVCVNNPVSAPQALPPLQYTPGRLRMIYVGGVKRIKGIFFFGDHLANERGSLEYALDVFGAQGSAAENERFAEIMQNSGGKIRYKGWIEHDDLLALLPQYDFIAVPSECLDNYPTIVLEAMAHGLVVIGSDRGGIPELLADGRGILFEYGNESSLRRALDRCTAMTQGEYAQIRSAAFRYVKRNNSPALYYERLIRAMDYE